MSDILYGRHPVLEALRAKQPIERLLIDRSLRDTRIREVIELARQARVRFDLVEARRLRAVAGDAKTQGVVAIMAATQYASVADMLERARAAGEHPLLAFLDGVEDPHNLGAILRSADAAGVHGVVIPKRRAAHVTATVAKTSAGAAAHVLTAQVSNLSRTLDALKDDGIWFVGADHMAKETCYDVDLTGPVGLVVGAEGKGLHRLVKEKCDYLVRIPMFGHVNSLNASVAAALLFFEARRQRSAK